ncbi:hypothetical protein NYP20_02525 [Pseudomonas sp. N3-W]|uniref:Uncharacterized protein n=1 Tax=Pseudomonas fungipugnans TaxID=3024217 RepID=A0ABT6QRA2_9PSED|nr:MULTISPECIES: hypothetical protein [unclassified Pseudomonas]MDI2593426.1 hypothetical protein [Pseudomonas sp. 681]UWF49863.1 hypothetical protein NYP20_02525 [Pseudomonas sp. N3-W]
MQQHLEFSWAQTKCYQCGDAEQTVKKFVMKAAARQKKQRAQKQEIAKWEDPQANEIEDSIGGAVQRAELHAVRFNPEVVRPFSTMAI